jgi:hypothetical protein
VPANLREQILHDFAALRVPLTGEAFDEVLQTAEQRSLSHLEFLHRLIGTQARQRRERSIENRIRDACEFGFDRLERALSPQAASLLYKIVDARSGRCSTALGTNIEVKRWGEYLEDPPLVMALLDRVAYRAIPLTIEGKSYRAHRQRSSLGQSG